MSSVQPGVTINIIPPVPMTVGPGTYSFTVTDGTTTITVPVVVVPCAPIVCAPVSRQLTNTGAGSCDNVVVPVPALFSSGPPGVIAASSPNGPYVPGKQVS